MGTLSGKGVEVMEMMERRRLEVLCVQETKWRGDRARMMEARWLQKTRKTTAKMGGLCEERPEKGRGGRKVERKGQQQGPMETNYKSSRTSE